MPVFKDSKTNTWYCKFYYTDYTGTRRQKMKRGFKLQREAKDWERSFLERQQGTPDMTFQTLYDLYIEDAEHRLRDGTATVKKSMIENHILPYFKTRPINTITPADIRKWQNAMMEKESARTKKKFSAYYLNRLQNALVTIFNYAVQFYNLPENPCAKAGSLGKTAKSLHFWTLDQYNAFLAAITDIRARTAFQVLFYSGMRIGECLNLTLSDLDFSANTIHIKASKTDNGIRTVTMPAAVMQEIQAYTQKIYGIRPEDKIFQFSRQLIRGNMKRGTAQTGIPLIRIHDLRHSHVSLLIDMGFTPHLIAERIGDTVQMVNNTYGHLYPTRHQEVADRLNDLLVSK